MPRASPELGGSTSDPALAELALPLGIQFPPWLWFQVVEPAPGLAGDGPQLFALAGSAAPPLRSSPLVTL